MNPSVVWTIARRELREALRHKWLWAYVVGFAGLATARPYDRPETSLVRRPMALETKAKDTV